MLLPKYADFPDGPFIASTRSDWLISLFVLALFAAIIPAGSYAITSIILPPGSAIQTFFINQRPVDIYVLAVLVVIFLTALIATIAMYWSANWLQNKNGDTRMKVQRWQVLNLTTFVMLQIVIKADVRIDSGGQSKQFYSLFTPAPWAFTIMPVLFLWEYISIVYQTLPPQRNNTILAAISPFWSMANLLQAFWCFNFSPYAQGVLYISSLYLVAVGVSLFGACYQFAGHRAKYSQRYGWSFWLFVSVPLTIRFGWVCAAFLVNCNSFLVRYHISLAIQLAAANLCLYVGTVLGIALMLYHFDVTYGLTIAWALAGVRCGTMRCLENPYCLEVLPGVSEVDFHAQILTAGLLTVLLLTVAVGLFIVKTARYVLMNMLSFDTRDFVLKRVPSWLLTFLE